MKIAFAQIEPRFGDPAANRAAARRLIFSLDADLFVLPELFNTGYLFSSADECAALAEAVPGGETTAQLIEWAQCKRCFLVAGLAEKQGVRIYNSCVLVGPDGHLATYRKIHLFDREKLCFSPGQDPFAVVAAGGIKIGMMICFDWIFPESMRSLALAGADLVCHPANLVLPHCQAAMITRCLENGVYAVTANRTGEEKRAGHCLTFTGGSQIVAPGGEVLARAASQGEEIGVAEIDPKRARGKKVTERNHLFDDRRPELYGV